VRASRRAACPTSRCATPAWGHVIAENVGFRRWTALHSPGERWCAGCPPASCAGVDRRYGIRRPVRPPPPLAATSSGAGRSSARRASMLVASNPASA
jgi:hypothetical protein